MANAIEELSGEERGIVGARRNQQIGQWLAHHLARCVAKDRSGELVRREDGTGVDVDRQNLQRVRIKHEQSYVAAWHRRHRRGTWRLSV